ncbi:hypothetical protein EOM09_02335 [bacterium]|nr:hypothetical protein [bacterium]
MNWQQYFYFIGTTVFLPIWILLFLKKESRKDMLLTGLFMGLGAVIIEHLYAKIDYWTPIFIFSKFPFEDFYYGFIFGGIGSELHEIILRKKNSLKKLYPTHKKTIIFLFLICFFSFIFFVNILKLNSIIAHIFAPILIGVFIGILRKDLFIDQIYNGIFIMILTTLMFWILLIIEPQLFIKYWYIDNLSGIFILKIPIEEYLFAFAVGFGLGNIYEFTFGYSVIKNKNKKSYLKK